MNYSTSIIDFLLHVKRPYLLDILKRNKGEPDTMNLGKEIERDFVVANKIKAAHKFLFPDDMEVGINEMTDVVLNLVRLPYSRIVMEFKFNLVSGKTTEQIAHVVLAEESVNKDGKPGVNFTIMIQDGDSWIVTPPPLKFFSSTVHRWKMRRQTCFPFLWKRIS